MKELVILTYSPEETMALAKKIGNVLKAGDCIAYFGDLGVGKTTFTRGLAQGLGLSDEVSSPTFSIVNEYHGEGLSLYHFDMYRICNEDALETTGFYDYPLDESIFAIEWAENVIDFLPENKIKITLERVDDNTRRVVIEGGECFENFRA